MIGSEFPTNMFCAANRRECFVKLKSSAWKNEPSLKIGSRRLTTTTSCRKSRRVAARILNTSTQLDRDVSGPDLREKTADWLMILGGSIAPLKLRSNWQIFR